MDLTCLYRIVTHTSEYRTIPKLGEGQHERADLVKFRVRQLAMYETAPLFKDYCSDFVRGVEQMAGAIQTPSKTASEY